MLEGSQMEEMTGAVDLGLFAGDAVHALGRTIESRSVADRDRPVLERGLTLIKALGEPEEGSPPPASPRHLAIGGTSLDVLTAIEAEAADTDVDMFLSPLAAALEETLKGEASKHLDQLEVLRRVFVAIGDAEVERVSRLSQPLSPSMPLWQTHATSSF